MDDMRYTVFTIPMPIGLPASGWRAQTPPIKIPQFRDAKLDWPLDRADIPAYRGELGPWLRWARTVLAYFGIHTVDRGGLPRLERENRHLRNLLSQYEAGKDCDYCDLEGIPSTRLSCPHCGHQLRKQVARVGSMPDVVANLLRGFSDKKVEIGVCSDPDFRPRQEWEREVRGSWGR
jgi:hypothetical protein